MGALALKDALHRLVVETDDEELLEQVQLFFVALKTKDDTKDWWQLISEKEKKLINKGLDDSAKGNRISHAEARHSINQLFPSNRN
jgi:hypothetical protein